MAVANWNFWEWGKTKYRVDAGKARETRRWISQELNDQIPGDQERFFWCCRKPKARLPFRKSDRTGREENFRIAEARYKERVARSTEVLDAQTLLTKAKAEYANALADYNIAYARCKEPWGSPIDR